jgi:vitamin B12 transporter
LGLNWYFSPFNNGQKDGIYSQLLSVQYSKQSTDNYNDNVFNISSEGEKLRVLWSNRFEFTSKKWLNIGLESSTEDFSQQGPTSDNPVNKDENNDTWSIVSDGLYALSEDLQLSASYRYDNNDIFDNANSYRVGATYAINNDWRVFISQGKAIKNPTFVERFGYFPNSFLGNPNLSPEQQKSTEVGLEGAFDSFSIQISWFDATLDNEILGFVFVPATSQFTAQNATAQSTRQGLELSAQGQYGQYSWQAQYSYLDASEDNNGAQQAELRRSRHTGSLSATYTLNEQHQIYVQADYTGSKLDNYFPPMQAGQIVGLNPYWLVSANYRYTHNKNVSINLRLSNVLNASYEDVFGYNTDGSRALLNLSYSW